MDSWVEHRVRDGPCFQAVSPPTDDSNYKHGGSVPLLCYLPLLAGELIFNHMIKITFFKI